MLEKRKLQKVDMEMDDVEIISAATHLIQHDQGACRMISDVC